MLQKCSISSKKRRHFFKKYENAWKKQKRGTAAYGEALYGDRGHGEASSLVQPVDMGLANATFSFFHTVSPLHFIHTCIIYLSMLNLEQWRGCPRPHSTCNISGSWARSGTLCAPFGATLASHGSVAGPFAVVLPMAFGPEADS